MACVENISCQNKWQSGKTDLTQISQGRKNFSISCFLIKPFLHFPEQFGQLRLTVPPHAAYAPRVGRRKQNQDLPMTAELWWNQADLQLKKCDFLTAQVDRGGTILLPDGRQMGIICMRCKRHCGVSPFDEILLKVSAPCLQSWAAKELFDTYETRNPSRQQGLQARQKGKRCHAKCFFSCSKHKAIVLCSPSVSANVDCCKDKLWWTASSTGFTTVLQLWKLFVLRLL